MEIIKKVSTPITWEKVKDIISKNRNKEFFDVGDVIPTKLKDGQEVSFVVAEIFDDSIAFVTENCLSKCYRSMNDYYANKGGWKSCTMRKYLNTKVYNLLPDDLKAVISEREIKQKIKDSKTVCKDNLWLLSMTEIGKPYDKDVEDTPFSLFKDERSRVKQVNGETLWYWLRSTNGTYDRDFFYVNSNGDCTNANGAAISIGVTFGFLVK